MKTTSAIGHEAESVAARYLEENGYGIIERNFKTPRCEIDVIAQKGKCMYFVEVKYRSSSGQGMGLDYITPKKQKQMRFAAEVWIQERAWTGEAVLSAIEVNRDLQVAEFIEDIS